MEKFLIHLTSKIDVAVVVNNILLGSIQGESRLSFETEDKTILINCFPIYSGLRLYLPYTVKLENVSNKITTNEAHLTILAHNEYLLCLSPPSILSPCHNKKFTKKINDVSIDIHNDILHISNSKTQVFYPLKYNLSDIQVPFIQNYVFIIAKVDEHKKFALIFDENLALLFETLADNVEFDGKQIIQLNKFNSIAGHGKVEIFSIHQSEIVQSDNYIVYTNKSPIPPANEFALPIAFLEAITLNDLTLARSYLHPTLNSTLSDNTLKNFFGNFISYYPTQLSSTVTLALIYPATPNFVKYFDFSLDNNHITNINSK